MSARAKYRTRLSFRVSPFPHPQFPAKSAPRDGLYRSDACPAAVIFWLVLISLFAIPPNALGNVVINEIMYHPPNDLEELQYIELFNAGSTEADLSGWSFSKGVKFSFTSEAKLGPGGFLIVCGNRARFTARYGASLPVAGEFLGHLSHNGERIELSDDKRNVIDTVRYSDSAPWPLAADGRSSSLERICPTERSDNPDNWAASKVPEFLASSGTPGKVNDSYLANLPPAISEVSLSPKAPSPGKLVTVSALVSDPDGVKSVVLSFRVATARGYSDEASLEMRRTSGDELGGVYEAVLPAQTEGALVRYRISAIDGKDSVRTSPHPNDVRLAWSYSTYVNNNTSKIPIGILLHTDNRNSGSPTQIQYMDRPADERSRGRDAFIYMPPGEEVVQLFDFVDAPPRGGGFKVHFRKDEPLRGMSTINIIFEGVRRYLLAEALSYEVYRMAGVPAELTEYINMRVDGRLLGYHLLIEQPNKAFLTRNKREPSGNLYKLLWYGNGIIGKHEKKTNLTTGHGDLLSVINGLQQTSGAKQWAFIQEHFNAQECIDYFAVNMCLQNWDGFHNNYFAYHDTGETGRWEIYPWDEDKTWGDYDGASPRYDWYTMPLTYGMSGAQPPAELRARGAPNGFVMWWREPGHFSGPLLANPYFRQRFLSRLREICTNIFTEEKIFPLIQKMEKDLEAEVSIQAAIHGQSAESAMMEFRNNIQSFRNQVVHRRKFILAELKDANLASERTTDKRAEQTDGTKLK